ncbi:MAG: PD-(D/E)XK nuclease family protein [Candidatus Micrarchaeaceae archaeon]
MSILTELNKTSIRVSDIASQYWCERQMEFNYRYGQKIFKEMKEGKAIHEELENEVNVPIILQPKSYSDALYKSIYTSLEALKALKANKKTREVQVYGSINGYKVVGKIDQLEIKDDKIIVSEDKTRANEKIPSESQQLVHKIQLMFYKKLLDDLRDGFYNFQNFDAAYHTDKLQITDEFKRQLDAMKIESSLQNVNSVSKAFFNSFRTIGTISDTLHIRYINQFTGKEIKMHKFEYKKEEMNGIITYILKYWNGERKAAPVPEDEMWKCNWCVFYGKECKTWWKQKVL